MPVFNGLPFLPDAIDSVLSQTMKELEFVIVDDASTDGTTDLLKQYASRDARIRVLRNEINAGIAQSLNLGISHCNGDYIARMDADDVCEPERLKRQLELMERQPEIGVCGTWFTAIGHERATYKHPQSDAEIKIHHLLRDTAICHPTAFVRRAVLAVAGVRYEPADVPAEDLWFWIRLGFVTRFANVPQVLLLYRVHAEQASTKRRALQRAGAAAARLFHAETVFGRPLTEQEKSAHHALCGELHIATLRDLDQVHAYADALAAANAGTRLLDAALLRSALDESLHQLRVRYAEHRYKYSDKYDLRLLLTSLRDPMRPLSNLRLRDTARFFAKCVVRHIPAQRSR